MRILILVLWVTSIATADDNSFKKAWKKTKEGGKQVGKSVKEVGKDIGHGFKEIFKDDGKADSKKK